MYVKINRIDPKFPLPAYQSAGAAAFDFYSRQKVVISPQETKLIPSNCIIQVPEGFVLLILPRSSAGRRGLTFPHSVGVIDADYHGPEDEIFIQVKNISEKDVSIEPGERVAQGMIVPCPKITFVEEDVTKNTQKSRGGFGSTGK